MKDLQVLIDLQADVLNTGQTAAVREWQPDGRILSRPGVDLLQAVLGRLPQVETPLVHRFTPGLYIREIFMPKGTLVISRTHKTEHPFVVSKGRVAVWTEEGGVKVIEAPFTGITKPGTRRILLIQEDCIWTTFHPTTETDPDKIVEQVTEPIEALALDEAAVRKMLEAV